jgi:hypothetical protein
MDKGGDFVTGKLLHFNGWLFSTHDAPVLTKEQLILLLIAAKSDWAQVDPSIFGTLREEGAPPAGSALHAARGRSFRIRRARRSRCRFRSWRLGW